MVLCRLKPGRKSNALRVRESFDPFVRMGSMLDDLFGGFENQLGEFSPRTDVVESEKSFEVTCELPGLDENDISVSLTDDMLTIEGEKKFESEQNEKGYHHIERSYGSFKRVIPFGGEIDSEKIQAEFKKGILKVTLPKVPEEKSVTKQIPVSTN